MSENQMKLSDYVAQFLSRQGIEHVFAISGGASLHLIHSINDAPGIDFVCPQHEQGCVMAADAYARVTGNIGVAIATSGPAVQTNMWSPERVERFTIRCPSCSSPGRFRRFA